MPYWWNNFRTMQLINAMKENRCLWDHESSHYRDVSYRGIAYGKMASLLNTTIEKIRQKIHVLQTQFRKECNKLKTIEGYDPVWQYFFDVTFLAKPDDFIPEKKPVAEVETLYEDEETQDNGKNVPVKGHKWLGWSDDQTRKFISLIRASRYLWDKKHKDYTNRIKRQMAYRKIGEQMGISQNAVAMKIHALRSQSRKQFRLFEKHKNFEKKWKFFDDVKFLYENDDSLSGSSASKYKDNNNDSGNHELDIPSITAAVAEARKRRSDNQLFWSTAKVKRVIALIYQHTCLWHPGASGTVNITKARNLAYEEIAASMKTTVNQIKAKYRSLRSSYARELKHTQNSENYEVSWMFFDDMKKLFEFHDKLEDPLFDSNRDDNDSSTICSFKSEYNEEEEEEESNVEYNSSEAQLTYYDENDVKVLDECTGEFVSEEMDYDCSMDDEHSVRDQIKSKMPLKTSYRENPLSPGKTEKFSDKYRIFGENVAYELQVLEPYKSIQRQLKCKIMEAILEANKAVREIEENE